MRHYEIVFLVHPDQSEQIPTMIERYRTIVEAGKEPDKSPADKGQVHRLEDWGVRKLAYPIQRAYKAHYVLMNVECSEEALAELDSAFRFNDTVIRSMIIRRDAATTAPSPLAGNGNGAADSSETARGKPEASPAAAATAPPPPAGSGNGAADASEAARDKPEAPPAAAAQE